MARKEIEIKIDSGRDAGKVFKITEMPAVQMDKWATKALCLLGKADMSVSSLMKQSSEEIIAMLGKIGFEGVEGLMDELVACASFEKDGASVVMKGEMINSVIEDWTTLFKLKVESLQLNLGFLEEGGESESK